MENHCAICYETLKPGERVICKECRELEIKAEEVLGKGDKKGG